MTIAQQLEHLQQMHANGSLSDQEFEAAKSKLLSGEPQPPHKAPGTIHGMEERTWCTLMHVSQLLNYSVIGIVVPIAMWIMGKDSSEMVRQQGNRMMNWIISSFIYYIVAGMLVVVLVGIPLLIVIGIAGIVFPIIAAIKANDRQTWSYPLAIRFLSED